MNLAIIPARGGSKRITKKNIVEFCGQPIIAYALMAVRESNLFGKIHVSTDSQEIAEVCNGLGFPVDFLRVPELADDMTPLLPVAQWVTQQYLARGETVEAVGLVLPCAPLITAEDLRQGHRAFLDAGASKPLVSAVSFAYPVQRALYRGADGLFHPLFPEHWPKRSQDLEPAYHDAGAFYFLSAEHVLEGRHTIGDDMVPHIMPRQRVVDIDHQEDLELAEVLFRGLQPDRSAAASQ